jgi:hypothetical protein
VNCKLIENEGRCDFDEFSWISLIFKFLVNFPALFFPKNLKEKQREIREMNAVKLCGSEHFD